MWNNLNIQKAKYIIKDLITLESINYYFLNELFKFRTTVKRHLSFTILGS